MNIQRGSIVIGVFMTALLAGPGPTAAQPAQCDRASEDKAKRFFKLAQAQKDVGEHEQAAKTYLQAHEHCPRPFLLFNAAQQYWVASEKQSSQTFQDKALALYQRYLETKPQGATAEVSQEKFFEVAEARWSAGDRERAEELYRRYLELAPGGGSRDVVTARVEEMEAQRAAAKAAEEEAARERAEAEAARAEDAAKKRAEEEAAKEDTKKDVARTEGAERDPRAALRRWPAWVEYAVLGTGAGLIAGGGLMHWRAEVNGDSYDAEIAARCPRGCLSDQIPSVTEKLSKAETQSKLATTGYIVGGLAVAAGVVMYRIGEREPGESRAGASAAIVTPMVTGEVMGGVISLRF